MLGKTRRSKLSVEKRVTQLDVRHCVRVVYTKATEWSLTTREHTGQAVYVMYQLGWLLATRTGFASLLLNHVINKF